VEDLKPIIARNITQLRQGAKMTQIELADKLNYSDKAVSKWERGESIPDVTVLKSIADLFGVTLDYLVTDEHAEKPQPPVPRRPASRFRNQTVATLLSILVVWFLATLAFVIMDIVAPQIQERWLAFLYALPVSGIVWLVFNSIWFNSRRNYWIISLMMWSALSCVFMTLLSFHINTWQIFLLGIPGQIAILLWSHFKTK
jgi:transcriptional regulator with XRE-family HTH domain